MFRNAANHLQLPFDVSQRCYLRGKRGLLLPQTKSLLCASSVAGGGRLGWGRWKSRWGNRRPLSSPCPTRVTSAEDSPCPSGETSEVPVARASPGNSLISSGLPGVPTTLPSKLWDGCGAALVINGHHPFLIRKITKKKKDG